MAFVLQTEHRKAFALQNDSDDAALASNQSGLTSLILHALVGWADRIFAAHAVDISVGTEDVPTLPGSKENLSPRFVYSAIVSSINRPALKAASSGAKGDRPAAIRSAFTKLGNSASIGKNSRAKVVLPAPFGPAMMTMRLLFVAVVMPIHKKFSKLTYNVGRNNRRALRRMCLEKTSGTIMIAPYASCNLTLSLSLKNWQRGTMF